MSCRSNRSSRAAWDGTIWLLHGKGSVPPGYTLPGCPTAPVRLLPDSLTEADAEGELHLKKGHWAVLYHCHVEATFSYIVDTHRAEIDGCMYVSDVPVPSTSSRAADAKDGTPPPFTAAS